MIKAEIGPSIFSGLLPLNEVNGGMVGGRDFFAFIFFYTSKMSWPSENSFFPLFPKEYKTSEKKDFFHKGNTKMGFLDAKQIR